MEILLCCIVTWLLWNISCLATGQDVQKPCADIQPHYLLQHLVPSLAQLPAGIQIQFDDQSNAHAFTFTHHASGLGFPAKTIFSHCDYFSEELSLLISFKSSDNSDKEESIIAIIDPNDTKIKFGVTLHHGLKLVRIHYNNGYSQDTQTADFKDNSLFDTQWHSMVVLYKKDRVGLLVDCTEQHFTTIIRTFPSFLSISNDKFYVGNDNRQKRGLFSGGLKQLVFLPGSDITPLACPERSSGGSKLNLATVLRTATLQPKAITVQPQPAYAAYLPSSAASNVCQFSNTGELWFDLTDKTLKVCYSGVWQSILLPPHKRKDKVLDYFVWYQDIVTSAPTIDIELFRIPGEGLFMATASFDSNNLRKTQSAIFKWNEYRFQLYQSLYTFGAQCWTHFEIGEQFYLAVANTGGDRTVATTSIIYRWSQKRKRFRVHQELMTYTARDVEYFEINGLHYLVVANHVLGTNHTLHSVLYRMEPSTRMFEPYQNITTTGAYDWTHMKINGYHFLVVANSFTVHPFSTTRLESTLYLWQQGKFISFQNLPTIGATDFEFFTIDGHFYLVVANAFDYNANGQSYITKSTIYNLNMFYKRFEVYQEIVTYSAVDWEFITIGEDQYLLVSNAQNDESSNMDKRATSHNNIIEEDVLDRAHTSSTMYRWQGVDKFVPVHYLATKPCADWETFEMNGETFIVYANAKDNISQVYKAKLK